LITKEERFERWSEYVQELFGDNGSDLPEIIKSKTGSEIIKEEVQHAIKKMKKNKASGPNNITTEMILATKDFSIDKITEIANDTYDTGKIAEDLSKSISLPYLRNRMP